MKKLAYKLFIFTFALLAPISLITTNATTPSEPADHQYIDIENIDDELDSSDLVIEPRDGEYLDIVPISDGEGGMCLEATPQYCENASELVDDLTDENGRSYAVHSLIGLGAVICFVAVTLYLRNR